MANWAPSSGPGESAGASWGALFRELRERRNTLDIDVVREFVLLDTSFA